jgi:hypothetical protein
MPRSLRSCSCLTERLRFNQSKFGSVAKPLVPQICTLLISDHVSIRQPAGKAVRFTDSSGLPQMDLLTAAKPLQPGKPPIKKGSLVGTPGFTRRLHTLHFAQLVDG